jgi:DNA recombination protein RmuC
MQTEFLILGGLVCAVLVLQLVVLLRRSQQGGLEQALRDEARVGRGELREQLEGLGRQQDARLESFARALTDLSTRTDQRLDLLRDALGDDARKAREESAQAQQRTGELLAQRLHDMRAQLEVFGQQQQARIEAFGQQLVELTTRTDGHMAALRQALADDARKGREETAQSQQRLAESLGLRLQELTQRNEARIGEMRATLEQQLKSLQTDNAEKLDQMRVTVDEKLQTTLEARLGASFQLVSDRLEQVQRGLGEMQQLATGVGDLKRVLTNVKNRGSWGEVQLDNILEQTLTQEQYARGVKVRRGDGRHRRAPARARPRRHAGVAADRLQVPARRLRTPARCTGAGRRRWRARAGRAAGTRDPHPGQVDLRQVHRAAAHHRLRGDVPAHRRPVRRSDPPPRPGRPAAARTSRGGGRADHRHRAAQQPADGLPHAGHRTALQ